MRWFVLGGATILILGYVAYHEGWFEPSGGDGALSPEEVNKLNFIKYAIRRDSPIVEPKSP